MLIVGPVSPGGAHQAASARVVYGGAVTHVHMAGMNGGQPGSNITGTEAAAWYANAASVNLAPRARWRASKGSAPVGRFTRAFSDNASEGWHRTVPVGTDDASGVQLAGTVVATHTVAGALTVPKPLAGAVTATHTAAGALTVPKPLAGAVLSGHAVTGELAGSGALLAGGVAATHTVAGVLSVPKPLAGALVAAHVVAGALTVPKPLAGGVVAIHTVGGALASAGALLAGGVVSTHTVAGVLSSVPTTVPVHVRDRGARPVVTVADASAARVRVVAQTLYPARA